MEKISGLWDGFMIKIFWLTHLEIMEDTDYCGQRILIGENI